MGGNEPLLTFDDPQVGDLVQQFNDATIAAQTASPADQLDLYKEAERLLIDEIAGIIPIYFYTRNVVAKPWLDRLYSDDLYLYRWSIDQAAKAEAQQ